MKEESGSHFPLLLELKRRRNKRNGRLSCKENLHKITGSRIPFIVNNVQAVAIPNYQQIREISFRHRHANDAGSKSIVKLLF